MISKSIEKIILEFRELNKKSKFVLKLGLVTFSVLLSIGVVFLILNNIYWNDDLYNVFLSQTIIKSSFTILAEFVIGSLVMDFLSKKL